MTGKELKSVVVLPDYLGSQLTIERDSEWFVNMTRLGKDLGKPWYKWKFNNPRVIEVFEKLEKKKLTKTTGPINRQHTWVSLVLALRVIADFDHVLSYHVFKHYVHDLMLDKDKHLGEIQELRQQLEIGEALLAVYENRKSKAPVLLSQDALAYGYECNNHSKFGNSFVNINGQRPRSHKTSVPDLAIGYLIYARKEHLQNLNKAIKQKFHIKGRVEHAPCRIEDLKEFVYGYMDLMGYPYIKEDIHQLKLLNIFLR
jgi:hypothetical protein